MHIGYTCVWKLMPEIYRTIRWKCCISKCDGTFDCYIQKSEAGEYFVLLSIAYVFTVKLLVPLFHNTSSALTLVYNVYQAICKEMFIWGHKCCRNVIVLFVLSFISCNVGMVCVDLHSNWQCSVLSIIHVCMHYPQIIYAWG